MRTIEIRFEVQVLEGSREEKLLNYLKSKQTPFPLKDMAMIALQGFLMPLAYRDNDDVTSQEKEWVVRDSIQRLQQQVQYFQEMLPLIARVEESQPAPAAMSFGRSETITASVPAPAIPSAHDEQQTIEVYDPYSDD